MRRFCTIHLYAALILGAMLLALSPTRGCAAADADDPLAWGKENIAAGKYAEAEELLRKALPNLKEGEEKWRAAHMLLIEDLRILGKMKDAHEFVNNLIKANPKDAAALSLQAELDIDIGNY